MAEEPEAVRPVHVEFICRDEAFFSFLFLIHSSVISILSGAHT